MWHCTKYIYIYIYIYIYRLWRKRFTNLAKFSLSLDLNFWHCFDIHALSLVFLWLVKKVCRTDEAAVIRNLVTVKKTKNFYNDQPYKLIKNIISYSISLQMININVIIFYQKNMSKQVCFYFSDFFHFLTNDSARKGKLAVITLWIFW